jgi:spermidine dehydrogenase
VQRQHDRELGMYRPITRRDFLNGSAIAIGAAIIPSRVLAIFHQQVEPEESHDYYPPALTGLRGSHSGSFEAAHMTRDGVFLEEAPQSVNTGETYDLVVVGGGISGLAAAHYFRNTAGLNSRILVIENHDDFGGHAKRNEFSTSGRILLGFGGSSSIRSPAPYSSTAKKLIEELGIDVPSYSKHVDTDLYQSLGLIPKIFFDKETFGVDKLVIDPEPFGHNEDDGRSVGDSNAWKTFATDAPLSDKAKSDLVRLNRDKKDHFPGLGSEEKKARLARISYGQFLSGVVGVNKEVIHLYQARTHPLYGLGIDAVSAQDAWGLGYPGFAGMNLDPSPGRGMYRDAIRSKEAEKYFFHFPDGNATIARLLIQKLIPNSIPGHSPAETVTGRADYAALDVASHPVRIRLNSTAVRVKHVGDPRNAREVEVVYARRGKVYTVRAKNCILACWNAMIPYICDELPDRQKEALAYAANVPLLYTNVVLRDWKSFYKLGTNSIYAPGGYHTYLNLDFPVSIGGYQCPRKPGESIVVHMSKAPCRPGLPAREQHRYGRMELMATSFEGMERNIREQMARTLGPGGFDPARDIVAITANRWPHGSAYQYNSLWDTFWLEGTETPCEIARKPFGRLAIANSDAAAYARTDAAIDQAYRAVQEITR